MQTKGEEAVAKKISEVGEGTFRHQVLTVAQRFKSSWVELGALLVKVRSEGLFTEWGYASFEAYCSKELRIKKQTALKLTNSYAFLAKHERQLVSPRARAEAHEARESESEAAPSSSGPLPAFEVISVLAGAEERGQLSEKDYKDIRDQIWNEEKPASTLARELGQRFPAPRPPPPPADLVVRRLAHQARKLAQDLKSCSKVPDSVAERAAALAEDVEELAAAREDAA